MPEWLSILAIASLTVAGLCALFIAIDILHGRRQHMAIMTLVWPITALYSGPLGLWAYLTIGRAPPRRGPKAHHRADGSRTVSRPSRQSIGLASTHCGSGCTLGDILAEGIVLPWLPLAPLGHRMLAAWTVDSAFAFMIGIAFQYFSIMPEKRQSLGRDLVTALKTDALSLSAWQLGMYGGMAVTTVLIFGHAPERTNPVFWFMMQIAMLAGFATSYPVNGWLLRTGVKAEM